MLSKNKRLNLKTDFKWLITGKDIDCKFTKLYVKTGNNQFPGVGISVSSKIFKKAVERNRARRLMSTAIEIVYERLSSSINILALPKKGILSVKSGEVLLDLEEVLTHEKIIS